MTDAAQPLRTKVAIKDCHLRPLTAADRDRVLQWRNQDSVRAAMVTDHVIIEAEHDRWLARALDDPAARYFVYMFQGQPLGFVSITGISETHRRANWAFYLGEEAAPRGSGAVMEFLALDYAFGALGLAKLCCEVFTFNDAVIRLHQRFGFVQEGYFARHYLKAGEHSDVVCLARFGETWAVDRQTLFPSLFEGTLP